MAWWSESIQEINQVLRITNQRRRDGCGSSRKRPAEVSREQVEIDCVNRVIVIEITLAPVLPALTEIGGQEVEIDCVDHLILVRVGEQDAKVKRVIPAGGR